MSIYLQSLDRRYSILSHQLPLYTIMEQTDAHIERPKLSNQTLLLLFSEIEKFFSHLSALSLIHI